MFSKSLALSLLLLTNIAFASGNGIERIRFEGNVDTAIAGELYSELIKQCAPAAVEAQEIVARPTMIKEHDPIDQGQPIDITYALDIELKLERSGNEAAEYHVEKISALVSKYGFSNPTVKNTEVHSLLGRACSK